MSVTLGTKTAIVSALEADNPLVDLLAKDPADNTAPAIFEGNFNNSPQVYPSATFRLNTNRPDARFQPVAAAGGGPSPIRSMIMEMELWDDRPDDNDRIEQIADRIEAVFDGKSLSLPDADGGGRIYRSILQVRSAPIWDNKIEAHVLFISVFLRIHS